MNSGNFKMNRNAFSMGKMNDDTEKHDYKEMSITERLEVANYLVSLSFGFVNGSTAPMDRTKFEIAKRK